MGGVFHGSKVKKMIRIQHPLIRECLAEFLGTFLLVTFVCATQSMYIVSPKLNAYIATNIGSGVGVMMAVWSSGGVSGGQINPAVTTAMWVLGRLPSVKVPVYWAAQYAGAFLGAACVFGVYHEGINNFDGGHRQVVGPNATAAIFVTFPQPYMGIGCQLADQIFATMLLLLMVLAITDPNNIPCPTGLLPVAIGLIVTVIGMSFGQNSGAAINPARDFSPRLFTFFAGYGVEVFTAYDYYFWIPLVTPHLGGVVGAWVYQLFVGVHFPDEGNYEIAGENQKAIEMKTTDKASMQ